MGQYQEPAESTASRIIAMLMRLLGVIMMCIGPVVIPLIVIVVGAMISSVELVALGGVALAIIVALLLCRLAIDTFSRHSQRPRKDG